MKQDLPVLPDTLVKLAFAIPTVNNLFTFLEAIRPIMGLGPFEHIIQLSLTHAHSDFWPSLRLGATMLDANSISICETIAKYYWHVIVEDVWCDFEWLKTHLAPETKIKWCVHRFPPTINELDLWTDLRITALYLTINSNTGSTWKDVLPRLHSLACLHVETDCGDVEDVFSFVANHAQVTEFMFVSNETYQLKEADIIHLIEWFHHQPIQYFYAELSGWGNLDVNLRQQLCDAMFNCTTLDTLCLTGDSNYEGIDFTRFTFPMKSLRLLTDNLASNAVKSFSSQLQSSKLKYLEVMDYCDQSSEGAEYLLRVLPRTSIKCLKLTGSTIQDEEWCRLAPFFENCGLESLLLGTTKCSPKFDKALAVAMQTNKTISEFYSCTEEITTSALEELIQSFSNPKREVNTKLFKVFTPLDESMDLSIMKHLADYATLNGCEFVHENIHSTFDFELRSYNLGVSSVAIN